MSATERPAETPGPQEIADFVRKVSTDDDFRRRLEEQPEQVLREHGLPVPKSGIKRPLRLPSRAALTQLLVGILVASQPFVNGGGRYWTFK